MIKLTLLTRSLVPPLQIQYLSHCSGSGKIPDFSGQMNSDVTRERPVTVMSSVNGMVEGDDLIIIPCSGLYVIISAGGV